MRKEQRNREDKINKMEKLGEIELYKIVIEKLYIHIMCNLLY